MQQLVSIGDIAKLAGVQVDTVSKWINRHPVPRPVAITAAGAVYKREDWVKWLKATGRKVEEDA